MFKVQCSGFNVSTRFEPSRSAVKVIRFDIGEPLLPDLEDFLPELFIFRKLFDVVDVEHVGRRGPDLL